MSLLEIQKLNKSFGGLKVTDDISLEVNKGEITALIGPNGAGKSTIFNMINGIISPDSGSICFDKRSLINLPPYKICELGISRTFQITQVFGEATVLDNVMVGFHRITRSELFYTGLRLPRCKFEEKEMERKGLEILRFLNFEGKTYELTKNLPFGEQRLVEVGRSLASNPRLILMDEPVSGFNRSEAKRFSELLKKISKEGITIFLISHDMGVVMDVSDKIIVIYQGSKISEGSPSQVRNDEKVIDSYLGKA